MCRPVLVDMLVTHANMKGLGLTPLIGGDHHGFIPPQLKTKTLNHACTPSYSSLTWKTKTVRNVHFAVCIHKLYLTNKNVYEKLWNLNSLLHTKKQLSSLRNKNLEKQCKMCTSLSVCVHCTLCASCLSNKVYRFTKSLINPTHQKSALYLEKQKSWKNSAKCALCSGVRSDLSAPFKSPAQKKLKLQNNWLKSKENVPNIPTGFFIYWKKC